MRSGDIVVAVGGRKVEAVRETVDALTGAPGSRVVLELRRGGATHRLEVQRAAAR